jgi:hypothetical protein
MRTLVDVVNVNGEASCLSSSRWIEILKGGATSEFFQWLNLYIKYKKKITLGLTGMTVVDILKFNPESIGLINANPNIFEMIIRPFSHDVALLRSTDGFERNIHIGQAIITKEFKNVSLFFLPPEFMLTNEQIKILNSKSIKSVFINSSRFPEEIKDRIPVEPYEVRGVGGTTLGCIPVNGELTDDYLQSLHSYSSAAWNKNIKSNRKKCIFSWRDGESSFLIPDGVKREGAWLKSESNDIERKQLKDLTLSYLSNDRLPEGSFKSYPVHSFSAWMEGLRMLGFLKRIQRIEENIQALSQEQVILWLHVIGSDILSAVEKRSPMIKIKTRPHQKGFQSYTIQRSERGFEGEEYLFLLEHSMKDAKIPAHVFSSQEVHLIKFKNRIDYLKTMIP